MNARMQVHKDLACFVHLHRHKPTCKEAGSQMHKCAVAQLYCLFTHPVTASCPSPSRKARSSASSSMEKGRFDTYTLCTSVMLLFPVKTNRFELNYYYSTIEIFVV